MPTPSAPVPVSPEVVLRLVRVAADLEGSARSGAHLQARVRASIGGSATGADEAMIAALDTFTRASRDASRAVYAVVNKLKGL